MRPDPVSVRRASGLGFVAQPATPTVFWWTAANPADSVRPPRQSHSWLGRHLGFEAQPRNRTRLRLAFLATMRPALDLVWPLGPSSRAYLSLHSLEATQAKTFRARSSPAPMQIEPQPAPVILDEELVHTMLSITHHTKERPSTSCRTLRSSISPRTLICIVATSSPILRHLLIPEQRGSGVKVGNGCLDERELESSLWNTFLWWVVSILKR
jgi:hypothetical protein